METVKTFVPRKGLLDQVRSQLTRESEGSDLGVRKVGIWGSGGTGKSQLARAYLQKYGSQYDATFWIHAISPATLERGFREIYSTLPNSTPSSLNSSTGCVRTAVLMWFIRNPGKWLLVFDEADELNEKDDNFVQISQYIPRGDRVHVIITSRSSMARELSTYDGVEIRTLELPEAIKIFLACAKIEEPTEDTKKQAELIVTQLGCLPLALTIAGSYVAQTPRLAADLSRYLTKHRERQGLLQEEPQQLIDMYGRSLMSTWETSYVAVDKQLPDACRIFSLLGFLGNDGIYLNMLTRAWPREGDGHSNWCEDLGLQIRTVNELETCFSVLEKYSMIQQDRSKGAYSMHSLVHAWSFSRLQAKEPDHFELFTKSVPMILFNSTRRILDRLDEEDTESNRQSALQLVPHLQSWLQISKAHLIDSADDELSDGLHLALRLFDTLCCMREGLIVLDILLQKSEASLGDQHPNTIEFKARWGRNNALVGNWDEGMKAIWDAMERAERLEDEHPTIFVKGVLEGLYRLQFDLEDITRLLLTNVDFLQNQRSKIQAQRERWIQAPSNLDNIVRMAEEPGRLHRWAQVRQDGLRAKVQAEQLYALGSATLRSIDKMLADEDFIFFSQNTKVTADSIWELLSFSVKFQSEMAKIAEDINRLADLIEEYHELCGSLLEAVDQEREMPFWKKLKEVVKDLGHGLREK